MGIPETRQKLAGVVSRRRFQALAAAGVLSIGLGVGAASGVFASPSTSPLMADSTPVATQTATGSTAPAGRPGRGAHGLGGFFGFGGKGGEPRGIESGGVLGETAKFLGMTSTDLQTSLKSGQTLAQIAVAHGKTATDLKADLLNQESTRLDQLINNKFPQPSAVGGPGRGGPFGADIATFLGISATDLHTAQQNGQTLAQVAVAHGKSAADLKTYLLGQLKTRLDAAVTAGKLTSQQETDHLNQAGTRIDQFINSTGHQRGPKGSKTAAPTATATSG